MSFRTVHAFDGDAPVMVFGGPVSNLQAVQALRAEAATRGIPAERVVCTGDVVAYCGDPAATVAEVRDWGCHVLAGNCERQLAENAEDCGCGFDEGSTCDVLSVGWYGFARGKIDEDARAWMAGLPDEITFNDCAAIHGGYTDIARFLWPVTAEAAFAEELARRLALTGQGTPRRIFAGHCGLPFRREMGGTEWINTGSLGLPPNDGSPLTCYAVLDSGQVSLHRLEYDWHGARERMRAVGLTQGYDRCLETGVWPSQEILPDVLRRTV